MTIMYTYLIHSRQTGLQAKLMLLCLYLICGIGFTSCEQPTPAKEVEIPTLNELVAEWEAVGADEATALRYALLERISLRSPGSALTIQEPTEIDFSDYTPPTYSPPVFQAPVYPEITVNLSDSLPRSENSNLSSTSDNGGGLFSDAADLSYSVDLSPASAGMNVEELFFRYLNVNHLPFEDLAKVIRDQVPAAEQLEAYRLCYVVIASAEELVKAAKIKTYCGEPGAVNMAEVSTMFNNEFSGAAGPELAAATRRVLCFLINRENG